MFLNNAAINSVEQGRYKVGASLSRRNAAYLFKDYFYQIGKSTGKQCGEALTHLAGALSLEELRNGTLTPNYYRETEAVPKIACSLIGPSLNANAKIGQVYAFFSRKNA